MAPQALELVSELYPKPSFSRKERDKALQTHASVQVKESE